MKREATDKLLTQYGLELQSMREQGVTATKSYGRDEIDDGIFGQIDHLSGMIAQMLQMEDVVKLNRWLGFVQGAMWTIQVRSVDELRNETRDAVDEEMRARP